MSPRRSWTLAETGPRHEHYVRFRAGERHEMDVTYDGRRAVTITEDPPMSTHKYQKKPVVIEAMRIPIEAVDGEEAFIVGHASIADWLLRHGFKSFKATDDGGYDILTLEGTMHANPGDWIIRGFKGEFYPCRDDVFAATYVAVES